MIPKNAQISELLEALQKKANISNEVMQSVQAYEVQLHKVYRILPSDYQIMSLYDSTQVYVAPFPDPDAPKKISAFHFDKDPTKTHGVPFQFTLKEVCLMMHSADHVLTTCRTKPSTIPSSGYRI
jgi:ubiquitin carboxyl-terminal hydrolase 7